MAGIVEDATIIITVLRDIPMRPKDGYKTRPDFDDLVNSKDLRKVENFAIENEHGIIEWEGAVDVTGVDFADCVTITSHSVWVRKGENMAKLGEKLNRAALVTLF